jgi:hypothetical protein
MIKTDNPVALDLENAATIAPYLSEKNRYLAAAEEIHRLQAKLDANQPKNFNLEIYEGHPWHADESESCVRLFYGNLQILKAPKVSEQFEAYWPSPEMIWRMLKALNEQENQS